MTSTSSASTLLPPEILNSFFSDVFTHRHAIVSEVSNFYRNIIHTKLALPHDTPTNPSLIVIAMTDRFMMQKENRFCSYAQKMAIKNTVHQEFLAQRKIVHRYADNIRHHNADFLTFPEISAIVESEIEQREAILNQEEGLFQTEMRPFIMFALQAFKLVREYEKMEDVFDMVLIKSNEILDSLANGIYLQSEIPEEEDYFEEDYEEEYYDDDEEQTSCPLHLISFEAFSNCGFSKHGFFDGYSKEDMRHQILPIMATSNTIIPVVDYLERISFISPPTPCNLTSFSTIFEMGNTAKQFSTWEHKFVRQFLTTTDEIFDLLPVAVYFEVPSLVDLCLFFLARRLGTFENLCVACEPCYENYGLRMMVGAEEIPEGSAMLFRNPFEQLIAFFAKIEKKDHTIDDIKDNYLQFIWNGVV